MVSPAPTPVMPNIAIATPMAPAASWKRMPPARSPALHANSVPCRRNTITIAKSVTSSTSTVEIRSTTA